MKASQVFLLIILSIAVVTVGLFFVDKHLATIQFEKRCEEKHGSIIVDELGSQYCFREDIS